MVSPGLAQLALQTFLSIMDRNKITRITVYDMRMSIKIIHGETSSGQSLCSEILGVGTKPGVWVRKVVLTNWTA
jgi:hypothetical protein